MTLFRLTLISALVLGFSQFSYAAIMGKVALTYTSHTDTTNGSSTKDSRTIYDIGGYYKFSGGGWVLGALYQNDSRGGDTSINRTSYGVSGGWMAPRDSGFFLIGTYFVSSTYGDFKDGNGYQADLGYKFTPGNIPIAMQISYKNYEYSKYNHSDTFIDPYFVIILDF